MSDKKIIYVDASGTKNLGCARLYYLKCLSHYGPKGKQNVSALFGSCLHAYAEHFFHVGEVEAMRPAIDMWREEENKVYSRGKFGNEYLDETFLMKSILTVKDFLVRDDRTEVVRHEEGKPWTEFKFAIPYYEDDEVVIIVCGTIDKIVQIRRGSYAIGDYKFTRSWGAPEKFLNAYHLDPQPRLYRWAIRWLADKFPDSKYAEIASMNLGFFIDAGFHSKTKGMEMVRSDVFYESERDQEEFDGMLATYVENIIKLAKTPRGNELPVREGIFKGQCKTIYGECDFARVCTCSNAQAEQAMLNNFYEHKEWNPLTQW